METDPRFALDTEPSLYRPVASRYVTHLGWSIFPLKPRSKLPYSELLPIAYGPDGRPEHDEAGKIKHQWKPYQRRLPTNEELVDWTYKTGGNLNWAIVTGNASGLIVLDLDNETAIEEAQKLGLPTTPMVRTRKGLHVYLAYPTSLEIDNRAGILPGVDVRGNGGYVVCPPSIHPSGHIYRWEVLPESQPLAQVPTWLLTALTTPAAETATIDPTNLAGINLDTVNAYGASAIRGELDRLLKAPVGTRNNQLNLAAYKLGRLVGSGILERNQVEHILISAGEAIGEVPAQVRRTVKSGLEAGEKNPRVIHFREPPPEQDDGPPDPTKDNAPRIETHERISDQAPETEPIRGNYTPDPQKGQTESVGNLSALPCRQAGDKQDDSRAVCGVRARYRLTPKTGYVLFESVWFFCGRNDCPHCAREKAKEYTERILAETHNRLFILREIEAGRDYTATTRKLRSQGIAWCAIIGQHEQSGRVLLLEETHDQKSATPITDIKEALAIWLDGQPTQTQNRGRLVRASTRQKAKDGTIHGVAFFSKKDDHNNDSTPGEAGCQVEQLGQPLGGIAQGDSGDLPPNGRLEESVPEVLLPWIGAWVSFYLTPGEFTRVCASIGISSPRFRGKGFRIRLSYRQAEQLISYLDKYGTPWQRATLPQAA